MKTLLAIAALSALASYIITKRLIRNAEISRISKSISYLDKKIETLKLEDPDNLCTIYHFESIKKDLENKLSKTKGRLL